MILLLLVTIVYLLLSLRWLLYDCNVWLSNHIGQYLLAVILFISTLVRIVSNSTTHVTLILSVSSIYTTTNSIISTIKSTSSTINIIKLSRLCIIVIWRISASVIIVPTVIMSTTHNTKIHRYYTIIISILLYIIRIILTI